MLVHNITRVTFVLLFSSVVPAPVVAQLLPPNVVSTENVGVVDIHVTPQGPWPRSVTHVQGPFVLYISNRSGTLVDTYSLISKPLASSTSTLPSLLDLHSDPTRHIDQQLIRPLPGEYELHFRSHPDWAVSLTISAK